MAELLVHCSLAVSMDALNLILVLTGVASVEETNVYTFQFD